jgi:anti-anti-sigma factor
LRLIPASAAPCEKLSKVRDSGHGVIARGEGHVVHAKESAQMEDLSIPIEEIPGAVRVILAGDAGMREAETLHLALTRILATRPKLALLDLGNLEMLASVAMGALLSFKGGLKVQGGSMKTIAPKGNIRESLRRARLEQLLDTYDTVEEATTSTALAVS